MGFRDEFFVPRRIPERTRQRTVATMTFAGRSAWCERARTADFLRFARELALRQ